MRGSRSEDFEGWVWVKTAQKAIALLATRDRTIVSLDHDLGDEREVGSGNQVLLDIDELASRWPSTRSMGESRLEGSVVARRLEGPDLTPLESVSQGSRGEQEVFLIRESRRGHAASIRAPMPPAVRLSAWTGIGGRLLLRPLELLEAVGQSVRLETGQHGQMPFPGRVVGARVREHVEVPAEQHVLSVRAVSKIGENSERERCKEASDFSSSSP